MRLEPFGEQHLDALERMLAGGDPDLLRFTRIPEPTPPDFALTWLARYEDGRRDGTREAFAALGDDGELLGLGLVPTLDRDAGEAEIGYIVAAEHRGRGVASAILREVTALGVRPGHRARRAVHRRAQPRLRARRPARRLHPRGHAPLGSPQGRPAHRRGRVVASAV